MILIGINVYTKYISLGYKKVSRTGNSDEKVGKKPKKLPNGKVCKEKFWDCKVCKMIHKSIIKPLKGQFINY